MTLPSQIEVWTSEAPSKNLFSRSVFSKDHYNVLFIFLFNKKNNWDNNIKQAEIWTPT